jgi:uncharacterized protein YjbJ (UPF0337 family)
MNSSQIKGSWNDTKGKIKEEIGNATGDSSLEGEGLVDRVKGKIEKGFGEVKDTVKAGVDKVLDQRK